MNAKTKNVRLRHHSHTSLVDVVAMSNRDRIEAWIRNKPKRIIQNQPLIQLLCIAVACFSLPMGATIFRLVFATPIGLRIVIAGWWSLLMVYLTGRVFVFLRDNGFLNEYDER